MNKEKLIILHSFLISLHYAKGLCEIQQKLDDITGCTAASGIRERTTNQQRLAFVQHALYQRRAQGNSNQARRPHLNICWTILAPAHQEEHYGQKLWSQQQAKQEVLVSLGLVRSVAAAWWYAMLVSYSVLKPQMDPQNFVIPSCSACQAKSWKHMQRDKQR